MYKPYPGSNDLSTGDCIPSVLTGECPSTYTKRPNLSGQAGDTLTHLKALILIHNTTQVNKKMVPATRLDQPTGLSARSTAAPESETFFSSLTRRRQRYPKPGSGGWVGWATVVSGQNPFPAKIATAQLYKIRNLISLIGIVKKFGCYSEIHNWQIKKKK